MSRANGVSLPHQSLKVDRKPCAVKAAAALDPLQRRQHGEAGIGREQPVRSFVARQRGQQRQHLPRQRHMVVGTVLHPVRRDRPHGIVAGELELAPAGADDLVGAGGGEDQQLQPGMAFDGVVEAGEEARQHLVGHGRVMAHLALAALPAPAEVFP